MGKDQELLEAARTGNLQVVKLILSGKLPHSSRGSGGLTGGLRSLLALKPVNINCSDTSGETPLHLAALNGHREVVLALLAAKASVTEVDSKGCTPLHLAAWNGHADICDILLQHASDKSIVNVQTNEGETPLHFAAQHGHLDVVSLLLQNKADPTYRTLAERSALDLAAQYGKTGVVRTLVTGRRELLTHVAGQPSPLHLAAFNGHLPIVSFLLDSGFPVNTRTDNGTALHEAATSCKLDVIKLLLDRGVDVWAKAKNDMTAEDILKSIHSKLTHEALQIISGHVNSQRTPDSDGERDINGIPGPGNSVPGEATPPGGRRPIPKPRSVYGDTLEKRKVDSSQSCPVEPQSPPPPIPPRISLRQVDTPYRSSTPVTDTGQSLLMAELNQGHSRSRDASPMSGSREQPKKPPRKTPSMRKQDTSQSTIDSTSSSDTLPSTYDKPLPPPPCDMDPSRMDYVNVDLDKISSAFPTDDSSDTSAAEAGQTVITQAKERGKEEGTEGSEGTGGGEGEEVGGGDVMTTSTKRESLYANVAMIAEEAKIAKPQSLELEGGKKRESTGAATDENGQPVSPSNYAQPPTPDCPPPSPSTALQGIQQKINPQDKRKSKDMETITETNLLQASSSSTASAGNAAAVEQKKDIEETAQETPPGGSPRLSKHGEQRLSQGLEPVQEEKAGNNNNTAATTTNTTTTTTIPNSSSSSSNASSSVMTMSDGGMQNKVEVEGEVVEMRRSVSSGDNPIDWDSNVFAGLLKGSTPGGSRNVVSQICENVVVKTVRSKRRSTPSTIVTFDPLMEREEDRDVIDADRVLDEIDFMTGPGAATAASQGGHKASLSSATGRKSDDIFDDSEEWAKIAATLETFGAGMARESVFVREYEASFTKSLAAGRQKIQSVGEWLDSLGLGQYENTLVANGFDDTDFLGGNIMEEQDLTTIGITNESHRAAIVKAARRLPPVQPIDQRALPESVERWLESLRLSQYMDTFVSHKYNTMERVIKLWELELNTVLDISSLGHRKRILASLGDRPHLERDSSQSPARVRRKGSEEEPKSPFDHIDLYRDYTGVKAQATENNGEQRSPLHSPLMTFDKAAENGPGSPQGIRDSQIHIRPPHLMHTTGSIKQWRHRPEVLIKGCCNYTAHYLGSTVVKELKGATSTQEGIAKLKKSTEVINKIPTIMLSISYKGVKFIDAKSKKVICDHEIANIFCACQDGDHLNFFAYVTKDKETSRHYCHVFSVRSRELAGEIILTLGEAFEIAYQMALKEKAEEDAVQFERQLSHSDQDDATSVSSKASVNTV